MAATPDETPTSFLPTDPELRKEFERRADELLAEVDAEDVLAEDEENDDEEDEEEESLWHLTVGQAPPGEQRSCSSFMPSYQWQKALETADGNAPDGFVILKSPYGSYVQALAQPEGFVLEHRQTWPDGDELGFSHYRARRVDEEGQPTHDEEAAETWLMDLETVMQGFECFSEYPDEMPLAAGTEWQGKQASFGPDAEPVD